MPLKQNITAAPRAAVSLARRRRVFAVFAGVALLVFAVAAGDFLHWVTRPRSAFYPSFFHFGLGRRTHVGVHGGLAISHRTRFVEQNDRYPNVRRSIDWNFLGARFEVVRWVLYPKWLTRGDNQTIEWGPVHEWELFLPTWLLAVTSGAVLLRWLMLFRREVRLTIYRGGLCAVCGYDIRATPQRCPECGVVIPNL